MSNIPINPAPKVSLIRPPQGQALINPAFCRALLAIMVLRNGGEEVAFSQADFDAVTGLTLMEGSNEHGSFLIALSYPEEKQS